MKKNRTIRFSPNDFLAAGSGLLFALSLFSAWFGVLGWICFAPLLSAVRGVKRPSEALRLGIISGTCMNLAALYWLVGTLTRFGGIPAPASAAAVFVFCVYSSLQFGIFAFFVSRWKLAGRGDLAGALLISLAWTVVEHFFPVLFPYGIGVSQSHYPMVLQAVDLLGVSFLGFLMFFVNVCVLNLHESARKKKRLALAPAAAAALVVATVLLYGSFRTARTEKLLETLPTVEVGMVQANFSHAEKNTDNEPEITSKHRKMSLELAGADLVIWPETSVQFWFPKHDPVYATGDGRSVVPEGHGSHFLIGGLSFTEKPGATEDGWDEEDFMKYNTAFLLDRDGVVMGHYSKTRLFLFGEYFPWINGRLGFLKKVFPMIGDLTPGEELRVLEIPGKNIRIGTLVCYEDIMAGLSRDYANGGANLLVNMTNDAWFGKSAAPLQHLLLSIPRAVETRRYLIRSTNSGISAIISPTGKVEAKTGIFSEENLRGKVTPVDSVSTLYSRVGDVFAWIALAVLVLFVLKTHLLGKYADQRAD